MNRLIASAPHFSKKYLNSRYYPGPMVFRPNKKGRLVCDRRDSYSPTYTQFANPPSIDYSQESENRSLLAHEWQTLSHKLAVTGTFGVGSKNTKRNLSTLKVSVIREINAHDLLIMFWQHVQNHIIKADHPHGLEPEQIETHPGIKVILRDFNMQKTLEGRLLGPGSYFVEEIEPSSGKRHFRQWGISSNMYGKNHEDRYTWSKRVSDARVWGVGRPNRKDPQP